VKYVTRHGKRIAVETLDLGATTKARKPFKAQFVKLPRHWVERLERSNRPGTFKLAHRILAADFKRQNVGGEIVLSEKATGLKRKARLQATNELVEFGLIDITQKGRQATKEANAGPAEGQFAAPD
jgi:hypothetical protein